MREPWPGFSKPAKNVCAMASTNSPALILPAPAQGTNATSAFEDIHGIRPPVYIPAGYLWLLWVAAVLAVAFAIWAIWKKWRKQNLHPKPAIVIPPHQKAKDRLRTAHELFSEPYRFCSLVSDVVRIYLEERFNLRAPERTTEEFLEEMRDSAALNPGQKILLGQFLGECDMVKFARFEPTVEELKTLLESALRLIEETAPVTGAEQEPRAA